MRPTPSPPSADSDYLHELVDIAGRHGVDPVGVCNADILERARAELVRRKIAGLTDGLQFTFKNPIRSTDPQRAVAGAQAVFVGARSYFLDEPVAPPGPHGRVARYAWVDHYAPLREGLRAVAARLRGDGWRAVVFADDNSIVDREVAHRAGIGWFGKNANLLVPGAGSWFVLGCVITTAPLPAPGTVVDDGCGSCKRCLDACPTGAIIAPGVIDAGRCLAWMLQKPGVIDRHWRAAIGDRIYGCDDCQTVCPPNVRFAGRHRADAATIEPWVSLVEVLSVTDAELMSRWGRWYIADRDPRWVRRNALVALGNVGHGDDPAVRRVLGIYLASDDAVLRVHAVWAARRLGLGSLLPSTDDDPMVVEELAATS
ncbi:MAG TPA: tRNA epoxyqueuosine(34) reductase QueG [Ilumatobacteraceae bacterium]|nr:tRNA epoxyqueuosine(34) reductase QueG [Ilumatobacteraceae bacterium]